MLHKGIRHDAISSLLRGEPPRELDADSDEAAQALDDRPRLTAPLGDLHDERSQAKLAQRALAQRRVRLSDAPTNEHERWRCTGRRCGCG